jgi:large repetitive protein
MAVTLYWCVYADGGADPTAAQIVAGQNATGAAALASGTEPYASGTVDEQTAISTLSAGTAYRVAWTSYDGSSYGNVDVSDDAIYTLSGQPPRSIHQFRLRRA